MATPSIVQSAKAAAASVAVTSPVIGNYIAAGVVYASTTAPASPTDTAGNTYTAIAHATDTTNGEEFYVFLAPVTATTGTNTVNSSTGAAIIAIEVSNCSGLDAAGTGVVTGSSTTASSSVTATSVAGSLVLAWISLVTGNAATPTTGTIVQNITGLTFAVSQQSVSAGTITSTWSISPADSPSTVSIALAGTGGAPPVPGALFYYRA